MSASTMYKCDGCGNVAVLEGQYASPPAGWITISIIIQDGPVKEDLAAKCTCSKGCAATIIRDYTREWRPR